MKTNSVLTAASALVIATCAAAHPLPKAATPAPNAVLASVRLRFALLSAKA